MRRVADTERVQTGRNWWDDAAGKSQWAWQNGVAMSKNAGRACDQAMSHGMSYDWWRQPGSTTRPMIGRACVRVARSGQKRRAHLVRVVDRGASGRGQGMLVSRCLPVPLHKC